jgi:hypothetical protein
LSFISKNAIPKLLRFNLVLTFDFAFGKLQREHPHKLSDYIVKERLKHRVAPGVSENWGQSPDFQPDPQVYRRSEPK